MSCERRDHLQTLAVEEPEILEQDSWRLHFADCSDCRGERGALFESLAFFKQLEQERGSQCPPALGWNKFSEVLPQEARRKRFLQVFKLPVAAGLAGAVVAGSLAGWTMWSAPDTDRAAQRPAESAVGERLVRDSRLPGRRPALPPAVAPFYLQPVGNGFVQPRRRNGGGRDDLNRAFAEQMAGLARQKTFATPEIVLKEIHPPRPANLTPVSSKTFSVTFPLK